MTYRRPAEEGVEPEAVLAFVKALEAVGCHSFMVARNGRIISEGYFAPYQKGNTHMLYSLSKTFLGIAIGFLVQEGRVRLCDKVTGLFPDKDSTNACLFMKEMTVEHLLTMTTGHTTEHLELLQAPDPVAYFLNTPVEKEPGSVFLYNSPASYVLSALVTEMTGQNVFDYLTPRLFKPLGITEGWWQSQDNICAGAYGLNLTVESVLKFGQFLLDEGAWEGKQLLNAEYIRQMSEKHADTVMRENPEARHGYGYHCWLCREPGSIRADGSFGQFCVVIPRCRCVVAVTSGQSNTQPVMDAIFDILLKGFDRDLDGGQEAEQSQLRLEETVKKLCLPYPPAGAAWKEEKELRCRMEDNPLGIRKVTLRPGEVSRISFRFALGGITLKARQGYWTAGVLPVRDPRGLDLERPFYRRYACSCGNDNGDFCLDICYTDTPFRDRYRVHFSGGRVEIQISRNESFLFQKGIVLTGCLENG